MKVQVMSDFLWWYGTLPRAQSEGSGFQSKCFVYLWLKFLGHLLSFALHCRLSSFNGLEASPQYKSEGGSFASMPDIKEQSWSEVNLRAVC